MKKVLLILSFVVATIAFCGSINAQNDQQEVKVWSGESAIWTKGSGTAVDPYLIETPENLAYLSLSSQSEKNAYANVYFKQTCDFDMNASKLSEDKKSFLPIGVFDAGMKINDKGDQVYFDESIPFNGSYDGGNHVISNLYVLYDNVPDEFAPKEEQKKKKNTIGGAGLFGFIGPKGEVKNLSLSKDCLIEGGDEAGSFASYLMGRIFNCHSAANLIGKSPTMGGLVGNFVGGSIEYSSFTGTVKGTMNIGAICGFLDTPSGIGLKGYNVPSPSIKYCYANAHIVCTGFYAAPAIGFAGSKVQMNNCYFTVDVLGEDNSNPSFTGRFIATFNEDALLDNSTFSKVYLDKTKKIVDATALTSDGKKSIPGVEELSSTDMKTEDFIAKMGAFFGPDINNENDGFPVFVTKDIPDFGTSYVNFKTKKNVGEVIGLRMKASGPIELIGLKQTKTAGSYELTNQEVSLHGNLTFLECSNNAISDLDATKTNHLLTLLCDDNEIANLLVGASLDTLYCGNNKLTSLDLSLAVNLLDFSCYSNKLTSLDLKSNSKLKSIICWNNEIEGKLDLSNNPEVAQLSCFNNKINQIDLAKNNKLQHAELLMNDINGQAMTDFMNALPQFVKFNSDEWDDYMGLNPQGLLLVDPSEGEKNYATVDQVAIAKSKGWPVYTISVEDFGSSSPKEYEGVPTGVEAIDNGNLDFVIRPIPADKEAFLSQSADHLVVYTLQGEKVLEGANINMIDTRLLADGMYVVLINGVKSIRMIVEHK